VLVYIFSGLAGGGGGRHLLPFFPNFQEKNEYISKINIRNEIIKKNDSSILNTIGQ
jgi:hypothetical protein